MPTAMDCRSANDLIEFEFLERIPVVVTFKSLVGRRVWTLQNIVAVAEMSNGDLYTTRKEVKVTIGGCGG